MSWVGEHGKQILTGLFSLTAYQCSALLTMYLTLLMQLQEFELSFGTVLLHSILNISGKSKCFNIIFIVHPYA